jgi:two-component sensor histidine kinase
VRYISLISLFLVWGSAFSQNNFFVHKKLVFVDSIFIKSGSYALKYYHPDIDSLVSKTTNQNEKAALILIKSAKLMQEGKVTESTGILKFALQHLDSLSNKAKARLYFRIGVNLCFFQDQPLSGQIHLAKADSVALKDGDPELILGIKGGYAEVNRNMGRLDRSMEIIQTGLPFLDKVNADLQLSFLLGYITTYNQLSVRDNDPSLAFKANSITDSLLNYTRTYRDTSDYAYLLAEKGSSLSILKKHAEAIAYFRRSQELLKAIYPAGAFNQEINLFHEYYNLKDYKNLIIEGEKILPRFAQFSELEGRRIEIHQRLAEAYEKTGNFQQSLYHTHRLIFEKEKADQLKYSRDLADLDAKYKGYQREEEIRAANIQQDNARKESEQKSRLLRYVTLACMVIGILLIVAIVFVIRFNLAKKRILQQAIDLESKNVQLDKAVQEKDFLYKELHHRVKNNIQLIISFMKLQYKFSGNVPLNIFIKEIEGKMHAMALVHEKLYRENAGEEIEIKEYLHDVTDYMLDSISNYQSLPVIQVKGDSARISIDKAIPIGLIINEAITNSIKHAFDPKGKDQKIEILVTRKPDLLEIIIGDNGKGFPKEFDPDQSKSLGVKAIVLLSKQIMANISWQTNNGAVWKIVIPLGK